ncbi:serine protease [Flagelloscypha sp. PMI_526]|nr:serine protease [Flagelloscypha sp. PMI_526]
MQLRSLATLLALSAVALAAPSKREDTSQKRLLVTLKDGATKSQVLGDIGIARSRATDWSIINGFAVEDTPEIMKALEDHSEVLRVEEDRGMKITSTTQTDAPWGLGRLNTQDRFTTRPTLLNYTYTYEESFAGAGVDVYMVDTGIRLTHTAFEGRATWGATFGPYSDEDGNGHGTHTAGTVGGARWGVAKNVHLIAVKVLDDSGNGDWSDFISAIDWVVDQATVTGRPSIISASLGGFATTTVDAAVEAVIAAGVHVVVAAGNDDRDANFQSPARTPGAITVGASTIADAKATFSNYGAVVDIFGPGYGVASSWNTDDNAYLLLDGTSMATPHVSGLVAYLISAYGNRSPADMQDLIKTVALQGKLSDLPDGTPNRLVHLPTALP